MSLTIVSLIFSKSCFSINEASRVARFAEFKIADIHENAEYYVFGATLEVPPECYVVPVAPGLKFAFYYRLNSVWALKHLDRLLDRHNSIDLKISRSD